MHFTCPYNWEYSLGISYIESLKNVKYVGWVKNFKLTAITAKKGGSNITGSRQFKDVYITGQKTAYFGDSGRIYGRLIKIKPASSNNN